MKLGNFVNFFFPVYRKVIYINSSFSEERGKNLLLLIESKGMDEERRRWGFGPEFPLTSFSEQNSDFFLEIFGKVW